MTKNRALLLTGGGARGAYQAGVLKYLGENLPAAKFETLVGASAGAINIAGIASGRGQIAVAGPRIAELWSNLQMNRVFRTDIFSLGKIALQWMHSLTLGGVWGRATAHSLVDTEPLRRLLNEIYNPSNVQSAIDAGYLKHVAISCTEVSSGSLVTFVQSNSAKPWIRARKRSEATQISVEHIMASSAIPLLFPSVLLGNRQYVDGCMRSISPLGVATRLGADKILAIGVRRYHMRETGNYFSPPVRPERKPSPAQLGALVLNSLFAESLDADAEHLERLNSMLPEQPEGSFGMKKIDVLVLRPSEDLGEMAKYFERSVPPLVRFLLRGLGSEQTRSSDILSYLLFVPEFLQALIELGYNDAKVDHDRLIQFFDND